jgi:hypothetical protein
MAQKVAFFAPFLVVVAELEEEAQTTTAKQTDRSN